MSGRWTLRTERRTGDLAWLLEAHAELAREMGWDATFEAYVAEPMAACILRNAVDERIWIAEGECDPLGCIAIVRSDFWKDPAIKALAADDGTAVTPPLEIAQAQLRWFLVRPEARGQGLGKVLLERALTFARVASYDRVVLWTERRLEAAAHLYLAAGFQKVAEVPGEHWGIDVVEEQYALWLGPKRWESV
ncbi:MAG TPA: GNAT family N-acetyltransferase [Candidatus Polarisedimenticolaceae bacterium]|nr:GNAT family N-acetyltransferase [Candidatus Polarisedimenticolaceae bacterium]